MTLVSAENLARSLFRRMSEAKDRRRRRRLEIQVSNEKTSTPTVYFLTPDHPEPSGGIRVIYRHVDILNAAGISSFVLHHRPGFRCEWFEHETRVTDIASATLRGGDLLVVPEVDIDLLLQLPRGTRHVIFNQNSHLTWKRPVHQVARLYAANPGLAGIITVSRHNQEMLGWAFGETLIRRIHLGIDPALFHPGSEPSRQRIAYMPRRGREDARQVLEMLEARGILDGWEVVPLDRLTHSQVADRLRTTRVFLAFTHQEGFGLPPAEAMACGNYVIGNHGFAGREFFRPEFSAPIESGDILGFASAVERAILAERHQPGWCRDRGLEASRFVLSEYSPAREREDVTNIYSELLLKDAAVERV
jgi:glycosyltransferase involved in cell wall biosynthesis